jgi:hypothetical protein
MHEWRGEEAVAAPPTLPRHVILTRSIHAGPV